MGTDAKGRGCLTAADKHLIGQQLILANQYMVEIRGFLQINNGDDSIPVRRLEEITAAIRLVQNIPDCDEENTLINSAKYAARALQKATGEEVYI
jgi:hypothetical protein